MKRNGMKISDEDLEKALYAKADGGYIGASDPLLDLGKAASLGREQNTGRVFDILLKNNSTEKTIKIQINELLSGIKDGYNLIKEGAVETDLKVAGTPNSVDLLAAYLKTNPSRVYSLKFKVDDPDQLDEPVKYVSLNVFGSENVEQIIPSFKHSENTNNPKVVEVDDMIDWQCSEKSTILYAVRPGRSVTLSIKFGASADTAHYLKYQAAEARKTITTALLEEGAKGI